MASAVTIFLGGYINFQYLRSLSELIRMFLHKYGLSFLIAATLSAGAGVLSAASAAKEIEQLPVVISDRLGLAFPGKQDEYYRVLKEAGLGVIRLGVSWQYREPRRGEYNWRALDKQIIALQRLGIKPFLTLYTDASWGVRDRKSPVKNKRPKNANQWQAFVHNLVERYDGDGKNDAPQLKGKVIYYQVANEWVSNKNKSGGWNGSADELIEFINLSYDAVKEADPEAIFVMGGVAAFNLDLMSMLKGLSKEPIHQKFTADSSVTVSSDMLASLGYESMQKDVYKVLESSKYDYADVHLYGESRRNRYRIEAIQEHTNGRPLLSSECGGPSLDYIAEYEPNDHFTAVFDWNLSSMSQGLVFCLWFQLGEGPGATWGNRKVALFDLSKEPKPGFWGYRLLSHLLQDIEEVRFVREGVYELTYKSGSVLVVAWNAGSSEITSEMLREILVKGDRENSRKPLPIYKVVTIADVKNGKYIIEDRRFDSSLRLGDTPVIIGVSLPGAISQ